MLKYTLQERLSHSYVDKYRHLDGWGNEFAFKELGGRITAKHEEGAYNYSMRVIGSKTANQDKQAQVLQQAMNTSGCYHEHDCCGCVCRRIDVRKVRRGIFQVTVHVSFNY